jgi:TnpA family transposase
LIGRTAIVNTLADGLLEADTPPEVKAIRQRVYRKLPLIPLAELLQDVDESTGCFDHLTHLSTGEVPRGERRLTVLAAIMGLGMNFGLGTMAASTPFSYRQVAWAADWHIREETLTKAQAVLDNYVLHHPFSRAWGDGTRSSSDGMRVKIGVRAANAERNAAHFGPDRGATIYTHTADVGPPYAQKVISTNDREALHVIDALCSHETDLDIHEHYTDTHGYTTHVFALCAFLGFRFAPRISNLLEQSLYTIGRPGDYGPFNALLKGRANTRVISRNWEQAARVAASIRHGTVSAALIMRKLAAYPRQNQVAQALHEIGQIEKTIHTLELLRDEQMRHRIERGLNKGELVNSAGRALFIGQRGEFRDRVFQDQVHRAGCLNLLIAAIAAWTTAYLGDAVAAMQAEGVDIPAGYLTHISPIAWEHVHLLGQYSFDPSAARSLDERRPLRSGTAYEDAGDDEMSVVT